MFAVEIRQALADVCPAKQRRNLDPFHNYRTPIKSARLCKTQGLCGVVNISAVLVLAMRCNQRKRCPSRERAIVRTVAGKEFNLIGNHTPKPNARGLLAICPR